MALLLSWRRGNQCKSVINNPALCLQQASVAFTTDHWTDAVTGTEYQSATAFYIDGEWSTRSRVLKIDPAPEAHTALNIAARMSAIIEVSIILVPRYSYLSIYLCFAIPV